MIVWYVRFGQKHLHLLLHVQYVTCIFLFLMNSHCGHGFHGSGQRWSFSYVKPKRRPTTFCLILTSTNISEPSTSKTLVFNWWTLGLLLLVRPPGDLVAGGKKDKVRVEKHESHSWSTPARHQHGSPSVRGCSTHRCHGCHEDMANHHCGYDDIKWWYVMITIYQMNSTDESGRSPPQKCWAQKLSKCCGCRPYQLVQLEG